MGNKNSNGPRIYGNYEFPDETEPALNGSVPGTIPVVEAQPLIKLETPQSQLLTNLPTYPYPHDGTMAPLPRIETSMPAKVYSYSAAANIVKLETPLYPKIHSSPANTNRVTFATSPQSVGSEPGPSNMVTCPPANPNPLSSQVGSSHQYVPVKMTPVVSHETKDEKKPIEYIAYNDRKQSLWILAIVLERRGDKLRIQIVHHDMNSSQPFVCDKSETQPASYYNTRNLARAERDQAKRNAVRKQGYTCRCSPDNECICDILLNLSLSY